MPCLAGGMLECGLFNNQGKKFSVDFLIMASDICIWSLSINGVAGECSHGIFSQGYGF